MLNSLHLDSNKSKNVLIGNCKGHPTLQPFDSVYYVITGYSIILNCTAINHDQSPNEVEFTWYQDNENITNLTEIKNNTTAYVSQLNIRQLDSDQHSGQYSCVAYNNPSDNVTSSTLLVVES